MKIKKSREMKNQTDEEREKKIKDETNRLNKHINKRTGEVKIGGNIPYSLRMNRENHR